MRIDGEVQLLEIIAVIWWKHEVVASKARSLATSPGAVSTK